MIFCYQAGLVLKCPIFFMRMSYILAGDVVYFYRKYRIFFVGFTISWISDDSENVFCQGSDYTYIRSLMMSSDTKIPFSVSFIMPSCSESVPLSMCGMAFFMQ